MRMKIFDLRGRPRPNKRQEVINQMEAEGLLDVDMDDWDLLRDLDDGEETWDDEDEAWWNDLRYEQLLRDEELEDEDDLYKNPLQSSQQWVEEKETD